MDGFTKVADLGGGVHYDVSLAHDHRRRTLVVVKALRADKRDDASARAGFARELDILSDVAHPSIVRLLDEGVDSDLPFMVLEHVDGPTLSHLISTHGHVQPHQWLSLAVELTSAIAFLHDAGFVHLDVKPSNVIMGAPATLIDLSLAMTHAQAAELDYPVGTDEYMAPEQCEPHKRGVVSTASDMWGIGATLYRAAVGHRAWPQGGHPQLVDPPREMPDFVPFDMQRIIVDLLSPDPDRRPGPDVLLDRLENLIDQLPKARLTGFKIKL